jgi:hypothetical protein
MGKTLLIASERFPTNAVQIVTSPPLSLFIRWRGGQGERWCVRRGLTHVPPLHRMERGLGREVESPISL